MALHLVPMIRFGIIKMLLLIQLIAFIELVCASTKSKPHGHKGVLEPYNGKPIPFSVSADQEKKLSKGESVILSFVISASLYRDLLRSCGMRGWASQAGVLSFKM